MLLAEGVRGKIVQERLGHANIAMTLDLSSHVTADMQRQAAAALEAARAARISASRDPRHRNIEAHPQS